MNHDINNMHLKITTHAVYCIGRLSAQFNIVNGMEMTLAEVHDLVYPYYQILLYSYFVL